MKKTVLVYRLAILWLVTLLGLSSCASNWPQFRGPEQNNIAEGKALPVQWDDSTNIRWTTALEGESWSSPVILVNKIFSTAAIPVKILPPGEGTADRPQGEEDLSFLENTWRWEVYCHDLKTGKLVWKQVAREGKQRIKKHTATNFAPETPVTDGRHLYVYFGMTGVYCYDLKGNLIWEKDLGAYKTSNGWGTGSSPVVYDGKLFIQVDNEESSFLVALDTENGEEVWRADRDETTNYSTPYLWENRSRTELVVGGKTARSYDPENGKVFWELGMKGDSNIPMAVGDRDYLYLGNTTFRQTPGTMFCVRAGADGDITPDSGSHESKGVVWAHWDAPTSNPSPLLYNGHLYIVSNRGGMVTCLNAFNGKTLYQEKVDGAASVWSSPWAEGQRIFFTDEKGSTHVIKAGKKFEYLHSNSLDGKIWTSPGVARDAYILKSTEQLYCIGL